MAGELDYRAVQVPLVHGLGTDTDRRMRAPERLEVARNVMATADLGGLRKRFGFTAISAAISGGGNITDNGDVRGLATTTRELLALGHRDLYGYVPDLDRWIQRGHIAPCGIGADPWYLGGADYGDGDCAIGSTGNVVIYAALRAAVDRGAVNSSYSIEVRGATVEDVTVLKATHIESQSDFATRPYHVRCCGNGASNVELIVAVAAGDPEELEWYEWRSSQATSAPTHRAQLSTDLRTGTGQHDCIQITGGFIVGWVDSSGVIQLRRYNTAGTQQATGTIDPPDGDEHDLIALANSPTEDQFYVLTTVAATTGDPGTEGDILLYARGRSSATLAAVWGPTTMGTLDTSGDDTDVAYGLGVAEGDTSGAGNDRVACMWGIDGIAGEREVHTRSADTSGADLDTEHTLFNAVPTVRPHWYQNRCYVGCQSQFVSAPDGTNATYPAGYCTAFFADIHCDEATRKLRYSSVFHVGQSRAFYSIAPGNVPHLASLSSTDLRTLVARIGEGIFVQPNGSALGSFSEIDALDKVTLRYEEAPLVAALPRGAAVIGGGYVAWYDSTVTFELGFISPPWIALVDGAGSGSNPVAGTYQYANLWEERDAAGYTHLSVPSPTVEIVLSGAENVNLDAHTLPATWRPASSVRWFRSSSNVDTVLRRASRASEMLVNLPASEFVSREIDNQADSNVVVPIYTTGGVLESVAPSGARIPLLSRESLWLAGQANASAVGYSPLVTPSTPQEDLRAPTLFESLSRFVDDGQATTGLTSLDGATVVLTRTHVYLLSGYGPDRTGQGDDVSRMTAIPTDAGCIEPRSVVSWTGGVAWQSARGFAALSRGQGIDPNFGEPVRALLDSYPVVTSAVVVPRHKQVRWTVTNTLGDDGRILVYDYRASEWYEWHLRTSSDATLVPKGSALLSLPSGDTYYVLAATGAVYYEDESTNFDAGSVYVPSTIETGEIQPAGLANLQQVSDVFATLERADSCGLRIYCAYDYAATPGTAEVDMTDAEIDQLRAPSTRMQLAHKPTGGVRHRSLRVRIEDYEDGSPTTGAGFIARGITALVAVVPGGPRVEAQART